METTQGFQRGDAVAGGPVSGQAAPGAGLARHWYVRSGAQVVGPVGEQELLACVADGRVSAETWVGAAGGQRWWRVREVPFLCQVALRGARGGQEAGRVGVVEAVRWPTWPWMVALVGLVVAVSVGALFAWGPQGVRIDGSVGPGLFAVRAGLSGWLLWTIAFLRPHAAARMVGAALGVMILSAATSWLAGTDWVLLVDACVAVGLAVAATRLAAALAEQNRRMRRALGEAPRSAARQVVLVVALTGVLSALLAGGIAVVVCAAG